MENRRPAVPERRNVPLSRVTWNGRAAGSAPLRSALWHVGVWPVLATGSAFGGIALAQTRGGDARAQVPWHQRGMVVALRGAGPYYVHVGLPSAAMTAALPPKQLQAEVEAQLVMEGVPVQRVTPHMIRRYLLSITVHLRPAGRKVCVLTAEPYPPKSESENPGWADLRMVPAANPTPAQVRATVSELVRDFASAYRLANPPGPPGREGR